MRIQVPPYQCHSVLGCHPHKQRPSLPPSALPCWHPPRCWHVHECSSPRQHRAPPQCGEYHLGTLTRANKSVYITLCVYVRIQNFRYYPDPNSSSLCTHTHIRTCTHSTHTHLASPVACLRAERCIIGLPTASSLSWSPGTRWNPCELCTGSRWKDKVVLSSSRGRGTVDIRESTVR